MGGCVTERWWGLQVTKTLNERITKYCQVTLESMAYAGTGDVLKLQQLLALLGEHEEVEEGESWKVNRLPNANALMLAHHHMMF